MPSTPQTAMTSSTAMVPFQQDSLASLMQDLKIQSTTMLCKDVCGNMVIPGPVFGGSVDVRVTYKQGQSVHGDLAAFVMNVGDIQRNTANVKINEWESSGVLAKIQSKMSTNEKTARFTQKYNDSIRPSKPITMFPIYESVCDVLAEIKTEKAKAMLTFLGQMGLRVQAGDESLHAVIEQNKTSSNPLNVAARMVVEAEKRKRSLDDMESEAVEDERELQVRRIDVEQMQMVATVFQQAMMPFVEQQKEMITMIKTELDKAHEREEKLKQEVKQELEKIRKEESVKALGGVIKICDVVRDVKNGWVYNSTELMNIGEYVKEAYINLMGCEPGYIERDYNDGKKIACAYYKRDYHFLYNTIKQYFANDTKF